MTPVLGTEALPIYSTDEFKLPGAPWMKELQNEVHIYLVMNEIKNSQITSNISEYFNNCDMKQDYVLISGKKTSFKKMFTDR